MSVTVMASNKVVKVDLDILARFDPFARLAAIAHLREAVEKISIVSIRNRLLSDLDAHEREALRQIKELSSHMH